ncbi:MAG TPA: hypothetical protein VG099_00330 [Gemmataceae bacterium]|jgi:hypothetical protein|nr:hypothetical protein [Gemmataceae bacterium]
MFELTPEQRRELEGSQPARAFDPLTKETYVLVRADVFERIKAVLEPDFDIREAYPLMDALAAKEGWADPAMDIYDDLDPRKKT